MFEFNQTSMKGCKKWICDCMLECLSFVGVSIILSSESGICSVSLGIIVEDMFGSMTKLFFVRDLHEIDGKFD